MGNIVVRNQPCLKCASSDARQIYEDGSSYCFSCGTSFKKNNEEIHVTSPKDIRIKKLPSIEEINNYPIRGFKERNISKAICEFYNVKVSYGEDGQIDTHYYPYGKNSFKIRELPKKFSWIGPAGGLFGKDLFQGAGKRIIICEGEIDTLSMATASSKKYDGKLYPIVGIPSSTNTQILLEHRDWLRSFQEIILAFDNDDAGLKATKQATKILGIDKVKIVKLHRNDLSDVFMEDGGNRLMQCIYDAAAYVPAGIIGREALWSALVEYNEKPSHPYPACLNGVNSKLKGMREGEITLFISGTGCFEKNTEVIMADGTLKKVQDVVIGDKLIGTDSTARTVKTLFRGREKMVEILLRDGTSFVCNESHILSLVNNSEDGRWGLNKNDIVDVKVSDYLKWSDKRKHSFKAFKTKALEFSKKDIKLDPYVLGVWLGDGYSDGARFACHLSDKAIMEAIREKGFNVYKGISKFTWNAPGGLRKELINLNLLGNKHIPEIYLTSTISDRLSLLAGLLDTDGSYSLKKNIYEFSQKKKSFIESVKRLAESLGFACKLGKQKNNKFGNCYRLWISGNDLEKIPCILPRKQARKRLQKKNPNRYSFEVIPLEEDDFYGFEVDGDNRFVLSNGVVTHNSGKSTILRETMLHLLETTPDKIGVISLEESPAETARKLSGMVLRRNPANEEIPMEELKIGFDKVFGTDRVIILDHQGSINDNSVIDQLEYMALSGCKYLFIDHITILVSEGVDNLTGNEAQDKVMNDLLRLTKRHPVWIGLVSHLRKVSSGSKSFEEGKLPTLDDIRGSGSIKQISFDIIAFARNLTAEEELARNTINMSVLKSRFTGLTGTVPGAIYNYETGRLSYLDKETGEVFTEI
jgi:hypothetical protein